MGDNRNCLDISNAVYVRVAATGMAPIWQKWRREYRFMVRSVFHRVTLDPLLYLWSASDLLLQLAFLDHHFGLICQQPSLPIALG
jgi:hypothetical protein